MESYSHLGINQQMNQWNRESAFCFVFFNPSIKRQVNSRSNIDRKVHGWRSFQPLVDCHKSIIDPTNCLIIDFLSVALCIFMTDWKAVNETTALRRVTTGYRDSAWAALRTLFITQHPGTQTPLVFLVQCSHTTLHLVDAVIKSRFNWQLGP